MGFTSIWHWIIVLAVVLILFARPGKISGIMGDFGKGLRSFKEGVKPEEAEEEAEERLPPKKVAKKPAKKVAAKKKTTKAAAKKKAPKGRQERRRKDPDDHSFNSLRELGKWLSFRFSFWFGKALALVEALCLILAGKNL